MCKTQPHGTRGGTLLPTEDGMWQVTLAEVNGKETIKTEDDFLNFAKSLPDPTIYEALVQSIPLTDGTIYLSRLLKNASSMLIFFLSQSQAIMP